mgnify:FL=1
MDDASPTSGLAQADGSSPPTWPVEVLVGRGREALILHDGQIYRLRITSNRKLILTK